MLGVLHLEVEADRQIVLVSFWHGLEYREGWGDCGVFVWYDSGAGSSQPNRDSFPEHTALKNHLGALST